MAGQVNDVVESTSVIKGTVDALKSSVEQTASVDSTGLEKNIAELQSELVLVRQKAEDALTMAAEAAAKAAQQPATPVPAEKPAAKKVKKNRMK